MASRAQCASVMCLAAAAWGQSAEPRPAFAEFEVATIKVVTTPSAGRWLRMQSANEFATKNHTLRTLLAAAYSLNPHAVLGGPSWVDSERYDIVARTPGSVRPNLDEQMTMLRKLLADRFHLAFHREEKEMRVFALTVAKGGSKLKESAGPPDGSPAGPPPLIFVLSPDSLRLPARYASMVEFANVLQRAVLDAPVQDRTGLAGRYDFDLEFTPDESVFGGVLGRGTDESTKPGLFTAIQQQLGLRLEAARGTVTALAIDRVERPAAN